MTLVREQVPPVVVGGVGGGGTRLVAKTLRELGLDLGPVSLPSLDNLLYTCMFTMPVVAQAPSTFEELDALDVEREEWWDIFEKATRREGLAPENLKQVEQLAKAFLLPRISNSARLPEIKKQDLITRVHDTVAFCREPRAADLNRPWGWKEPNTSIFLPHILKHFPNAKYIHVIRHGLDMTFSGNLNQVISWGPLFGIPRSYAPDPTARLEYWVRANERTISHAERELKENFLLLRFDELVSKPADVIPTLCAFLGVRADGKRLQALCRIPRTPASLGRYKEQDLSMFRPELIDSVRQFGFEVPEGVM